MADQALMDCGEAVAQAYEDFQRSFAHAIAGYWQAVAKADTKAITSLLQAYSFDDEQQSWILGYARALEDAGKG